MKVLLSFLLTPLSFIGYMVLSMNFGISSRVPVFIYLWGLLGLGLMFHFSRQKFTKAALGMNVLGWLLMAGFFWWTLSYSEYGPLKPQFTTGDKVLDELAAIELQDHTGTTVNGMDLLVSSGPSLLVFYRGYW